QPGVVDAEVVGDLVHDGDRDLLDHVVLGLADRQDRLPVEGDPVRQQAAVVVPALGQRDAFVQTEQVRVVRVPLLDQHDHVVHQPGQLLGHLVQGVADELLEPAPGDLDHGSRKPRGAGRDPGDSGPAPLRVCGDYFVNAPTAAKRWSANTEAALRTPSQVRPSVSTSRRSLVPLVSLSGPDVPMIGSPPRTPPVEPPPSTMTPWAWPWSVPWPPFSPAVRPNSVVVSSDTNGRSSAPRSWKNALSAPAASFAWSCSWPFELVWVSNPPMSMLTNRSPTLALISWAAVLNACASPVSGYGEAGWYSLLLSVLIVLIAFSVSSAVVATGSLYCV